MSGSDKDKMNNPDIEEKLLQLFERLVELSDKNYHYKHPRGQSKIGDTVYFEPAHSLFASIKKMKAKNNLSSDEMEDFLISVSENVNDDLLIVEKTKSNGGTAEIAQDFIDWADEVRELTDR